MASPLRTRLAATATAAGALAALAALAAPASAATTAPPAVLAHPDSDTMGSTVARNDPSARTTPMTASGASAVTGVRGMDVSRWQGNVAWSTAWANGARFAYVKATESTNYTNPYFAQQYNGSYGVGMVRGAYHFALPDRSSGVAQADWFVNHGGGWSSDGRTLPPLLDIEYNPYGATCYGLTPSAMGLWLQAFSDRVKLRTGRFPAIYTTTDWWNRCTGSNPGFGQNPLFIARYSSTVGTLPASWRGYAFWQWSDKGVLPGDQDVYNGSVTTLKTFARG